MSIDNRGKGFTSKFRVGHTVVQNVVSGVGTLIQFGGFVDFDLLNEFNNALFRFVPLEAGYYFFSCSLALNLLNVGDIFEVQITLNGAWTHHQQKRKAIVGLENVQTQGLLYVTPVDFVDIYGVHNSGVNRAVINAVTETIFEGWRVG